jgi:multicomponent Na+:H+ antiporter subunit D
MGAFWNPREDGVSDPPGERLGRGPVLMVAPTAFLVACSLAIAVAAGPIYSFSERTARELLDRDAYIGAVLDR